jgi:hypothetical protein
MARASCAQAPTNESKKAPKILGSGGQNNNPYITFAGQSANLILDDF